MLKAYGAFMLLGFLLILPILVFMKTYLLCAVSILFCMSGCTVKTIDVVPSDPGCVCFTLYDPVCVMVSGNRHRYSNSCAAGCDGFTEDDFINCPN